MKDDFNHYLEKTLSNENIDSSFVYLDGSGQLHIVGKVYSFIRMSDRLTDLNMDDFDLVPDYDVPLGEQG